MVKMTLIQGDCLKVLPTIPDNSIDLVLTDPPYFLPAVHYQTRKQFQRSFADLGILDFFFTNFFKEISRIMKKDGSIYIFCDGQSYPLFYWNLYQFCKSVRPLIWDKKISINGYSWRHQHELIIFAEMPKAKPIPSGDGDILRFSAVKVNERQHPAEKPFDLIKTLIKKSLQQDGIIIDPFVGSGTTMKAAIDLNKNCIGIEVGREYIEICKKRLNWGSSLSDKIEWEFKDMSQRIVWDTI
jgi:site-specific DNA-methyltransferase (adenine-specific)